MSKSAYAGAEAITALRETSATADRRAAEGNPSMNFTSTRGPRARLAAPAPCIDAMIAWRFGESAGAGPRISSMRRPRSTAGNPTLAIPSRSSFIV